MTAFRFTQLSAVFVFMSNRNKIRQVVTCKDGSKKAVFHDKKFSKAEYADRKEFWNMLNKQPKPNSKRQQKLRLLPAHD